MDYSSGLSLVILTSQIERKSKKNLHPHTIIPTFAQQTQNQKPLNLKPLDGTTLPKCPVTNHEATLIPMATVPRPTDGDTIAKPTTANLSIYS